MAVFKGEGILTMDEVAERFAKFTADKHAIMPEGYSAPLEIKTTRERINERLRSNSTDS